ncbi:MAG: hypothetical protein SV375_10920 [Thermodesulfobacteriota bacterium]|nr:hypothetical protein [Thermodesulfobacteriota bacterium]
MEEDKMVLTNRDFEIMGSKENQDTLKGVLEKPLPPKFAYWIARALAKIQSESKVFFETKNRLMRQYAVLEEDDKIKTTPGGLVVWDAAKGGFEKFQVEFEQLLDTEVPLDMNRIRIDLEELEARNVTFTPAEFILLPFVSISEETPKEP